VDANLAERSSPSTLSLRSSYAGRLRADGPRLAVPRVARQGEAWWARQDSNLQPDRCARAPLDHEGLQRVSLRRIAIAGMDIIWYMHII
jgi:hypothetical protein